MKQFLFMIVALLVSIPLGAMEQQSQAPVYKTGTCLITVHAQQSQEGLAVKQADAKEKLVVVALLEHAEGGVVNFKRTGETDVLTVSLPLGTQRKN